MKRSTLTLSILTALLVSACGGSSSNDEQTKDPTPSKVTPTHPTTPSTGKTPTTGNKDNAGSSAGSSASSSSSSDPTPPISSGSAPSGGKPIVIENETGKTKEKDKDKDKEPKDDPIKSIQDDLAAARSELTKAKELEDEKKRRYEELMNPDMTTGVVNKRWTEQNSKRTTLASELGLGTPSADEHFDIETFKKTIEKKKGTPGFDYDGKLAALKNYEDLRNEWLTAKAKALEVRGEWEKAQLETAKQKKKVAELEADILEKTAEVGSEKALAAKMKQQAKLIYKQEEAKVEAAEITAKLKQLGTDGRELVKKQKDLTKAAELDPNDKKLAERLKEANEDVKKNTKDQEDLTEAQTKANAAAKSAKTKFDSIDKEVKNLEEIAGNRGVMGKGNLSAENFLEIDQAEAIRATGGSNNIETWKLTLKDGAAVEIEVKAGSSLNTELKSTPTGSSSQATYGHFGEIGGNDSKVKAAYNNITDAKTSIYGFIGDQFYSVGTVTPADEVKKLTDPAAGYSGRALLKAESGQDLIADVKAEVDFKAGSLTGNFHSFKTYKDNGGTLMATELTSENAELKTKLKDDKVKFAASIKGNKFATESEKTGQANVYGYFYGKGDKAAKELGGLVEYKNVFHGSFGGAAE